MRGLLIVDDQEYVIEHFAKFAIEYGCRDGVDFVITIKTAKLENTDAKPEVVTEQVQTIAVGVGRPSTRGIGAEEAGDRIPLSEVFPNPDLLLNERRMHNVKMSEILPKKGNALDKVLIRTKYYHMEGSTLALALRELVEEEKRIAGTRALFVTQPAEVAFNKDRSKFRFLESVVVADDSSVTTGTIELAAEEQGE